MRKLSWFSVLLTVLLSQTSFAQPTSREEAAELIKVMEQSAISGSLGIDETSRKEIMGIKTKSPDLQRFVDWTTRYDQNLRGVPEDPMPGAVLSFLVSFPYESSSMFDFGHALPPESGFDTSQAAKGALYPALSWKRYDSTGHTGVILPQECLHNPGYVTYFLATRIIIPGDKPVQANLEIPSTTPVVAWLNQHKVLENLEKGAIPVPKYGDRFPVELKPGENILVLKVAALEDQPAFYVFLTDAQSRQPLSFTIDLENPIVSGALDDARVENSEKSTLAQMLDDPEVSNVDKAFIAREILSSEDAQRQMNALLLSDIDAMSELSPQELEIAMLALDDPSKSLQFLTPAMQKIVRGPQLRILYARQKILASEQQGDRGARFVDEWPTIREELLSKPPHPDYEPLRRKILALAELNHQQALTALEKMDLKSCPNCETYLMPLVMGSLEDTKNQSKYREMLEKLYAHQKNASAYLVDILDMHLRRAVSANDDNTLARELAHIQEEVQSFFDRHPYDDYLWAFWLRTLTEYGTDSKRVQNSQSLQTAYQSAGFNADADSWYLLYLTQRVNDPQRWLIYAEHCIHTGQTAEVVSAYEMMARLLPQNESIAQRASMYKSLNHMADEQTANEEDTSFETPYIIKDIPANRDPKATGLVSLLDNRVVRILPNGLSSAFNQIAFEILDEQGLKSVRSMPINYSPSDEKLEIISVTTTKKDGSVRTLYNTSEFNMADESIRMYYDQRQIVIEVPDLAIGDRIEYRFKRTQMQRASSSIAFFSDVYQLQTWFNRQWSRYTVIAPESIPIHLFKSDPAGSKSISGTVTKKDGLRITSYEEKDTPRFLSEDKMPGATEVMPFLLISSLDSWQQMADWYVDLAAPQWKADEAIRAEVKKLTEGLTDNFEKLKKIHSFVVKSTRYVALEFGIHGHKPYPASQVFERRFGDCKDKASLLKVMLEEAGIPTKFVLVRTRQNGDVAMDLPNPYLFDHAIAYVPEFDLFIDGTAEFSGTRELPALDQDASVFIVDENAHYELRKIPVSKAADNISKHQWHFDLTDPQKSKITYTDDAVYSGFFAPSYRERYQIDSLQKERLESEIAYSIPGSHIESYEFSDLSDLEKDVQVKFTAETSFSDIVKTDGDAWLIHPTISVSRLAQMLAPSATRRTPIIQVSPITFEQVFTVQLPPGAQITLPADISENSEFGSYNIAAKFENNQLITSVTIALDTIKVPPEKYAQYLDFIQKFDRRLNTQYRITMGN